jgi:curved DNA-binding protein CbpA
MVKPHELLGVTADADEAAIKVAFRNAAKNCHPDIHSSDPRAARRFRRLVAARDMLSKKARRSLPSQPEWKSLIDRTAIRRRWTLMAGASAGACAFLVILCLSQSWSSRPAAAPFETESVSMEETEAPDAGSSELKLIRDLSEELDSGRSGSVGGRINASYSSAIAHTGSKPWLRRLRKDARAAASKVSRGITAAASRY